MDLFHNFGFVRQELLITDHPISNRPLGPQQVRGLTKGASYHVRVSAYNGVSLSYGSTRPSTPPISHPGDAPEPPPRIDVEAASPSSLSVTWSPPTDPMGAQVSRYRVVRY